MDKILVLNSGSSSLKFQVLQMPDENVLASGLIDKIGLPGSGITYKNVRESFSYQEEIESHYAALLKVSELLMDTENGAISTPDEILGIGHRVVHGGSHFKDVALVSAEIKNQIRELFSMAPLHNPANLVGIEVAETVFPNSAQIAVFDTAFHQTIPEKAYRYAIPNSLFKEEGIRLYGFHGTSHQYVSARASEYLKNKEAKMVVLHLGNGCSATAVKNGKSVDHSMGFGPLNGLVMGTRSGDIDPSVLLYLLEKGYSAADIHKLLNKESGMLGLSGYSDLREIVSQFEKGNKDCGLSLEINAYRIKKYIGAYAAAMNGLDAIVFTAGVGENSPLVRRMACEGLEFFGINIDLSRNEKGEFEIQSEKSKVKILVIPTNEELAIARQTYAKIKA